MSSWAKHKQRSDDMYSVSFRFAFNIRWLALLHKLKYDRVWMKFFSWFLFCINGRVQVWENIGWVHRGVRGSVGECPFIPNNNNKNWKNLYEKAAARQWLLLQIYYNIKPHKTHFSIHFVLTERTVTIKCMHS